MTHLEHLTPGSRLDGLVPGAVVTIVAAKWNGSAAVTLTYRTDDGKTGERLVYRDDEEKLSLAQSGRPWSFDADGDLFRLASEARRIELAWMFDPYLAVQTSRLEPLPHQLQAVYHNMLDRQPLRFLLADDPGAGKTIMAGLLIKELGIRGVAERILVVAPGGLVDQWQDELDLKFGLRFEILTRELIESSRTGNPFDEKPHLIARLDQLARSEDDNTAESANSNQIRSRLAPPRRNRASTSLVGCRRRPRERIIGSAIQAGRLVAAPTGVSRRSSSAIASRTPE